MNKEIRMCSNYILSENDPKHIFLDSQGICNYCNYYYDSMQALGTVEKKSVWLDNKITEIKKAHRDNKYDCILGVSGGVDSTFLACWCKQNNLRPLLVHFDNGWNSKLSIKNIENICVILGYNLNTFVINWQEFKALQLAYLRAGVIDIEVLTDHAIYATLVKIAKHHKKYILSEFNLSAEDIMPKGWVFDKLDTCINMNIIEPVIGHLKHNYRMLRNFLKGNYGDAINVLLAPSAMNFKRMMNIWKADPSFWTQYLLSLLEPLFQSLYLKNKCGKAKFTL